MEHLIVRRVRPTEVSTLQRLSKTIFIEAFGPLNTPENMDDYVSKSFNLPQLQRELENPESEFYFVEEATETIGYLKINYGKAQTEPIPDGLEVERIYVGAVHRGKRIGQLLFEKAMTRAQELHKTTLWLGVWEKNRDAIRFYQRNGMTLFGQHPFMLGKDLQIDLLMKRPL